MEFGVVGELCKNFVVICEVIEVKDGGLEVKIVDSDLIVFVCCVDFSCDCDEQCLEKFFVGDKFDVCIIQFDKKICKVIVLIKVLEIVEEKEVVVQYGFFDSGVFFGDILGVVLK